MMSTPAFAAELVAGHIDAMCAAFRSVRNGRKGVESVVNVVGRGATGLVGERTPCAPALRVQRVLDALAVLDFGGQPAEGIALELRADAPGKRIFDDRFEDTADLVAAVGDAAVGRRFCDDVADGVVEQRAPDALRALDAAEPLCAVVLIAQHAAVEGPLFDHAAGAVVAILVMFTSRILNATQLLPLVVRETPHLAHGLGELDQDAGAGVTHPHRLTRCVGERCNIAQLVVGLRRLSGVGRDERRCARHAIVRNACDPIEDIHSLDGAAHRVVTITRARPAAVGLLDAVVVLVVAKAKARAALPLLTAGSIERSDPTAAVVAQLNSITGGEARADEIAAVVIGVRCLVTLGARLDSELVAFIAPRRLIAGGVLERRSRAACVVGMPRGLAGGVGTREEEAVLVVAVLPPERAIDRLLDQGVAIIGTDPPAWLVVARREDVDRVVVAALPIKSTRVQPVVAPRPSPAPRERSRTASRSSGSSHRARSERG